MGRTHRAGDGDERGTDQRSECEPRLDLRLGVSAREKEQRLGKKERTVYPRRSNKCILPARYKERYPNPANETAHLSASLLPLLTATHKTHAHWGNS